MTLFFSEVVAAPDRLPIEATDDALARAVVDEIERTILWRAVVSQTRKIVIDGPLPQLLELEPTTAITSVTRWTSADPAEVLRRGHLRRGDQRPGRDHHRALVRVRMASARSGYRELRVDVHGRMGSHRLLELGPRIREAHDREGHRVSCREWTGRYHHRIVADGRRPQLQNRPDTPRDYRHRSRLPVPTIAVYRTAMNRRADAITARIAAVKRRLLAGGVLQEVQWGVPDPPRDPPDVRGRRHFTYTPIDALIDQRPALDRSRIDTTRADDTVLTILDPVAVTDEHLFRWGDPPDVYSVSKVDGVIQDESTGVRFFSTVTVVR